MTTPSLNPSLPRERALFNPDWRFALGEPPEVSKQLTYERLRPWLLAGSQALGAEPSNGEIVAPSSEPAGGIPFLDPDFDDSAWRALDLPHDWGIENAFDIDRPGRTGKLPWPGVGWYRKRFHLPANARRERRVELLFDGAMSHPLVWLNGHFVGGWVYGYSSFRVDLTPHLRPDGENVLAVRLDNPADSSRWYPGSGLYRNVWLELTPTLRFAPWGIFVHTPEVSPERALVQVDSVVESGNVDTDLFQLSTEIYALNPDGQRSAQPVATAPRLEIQKGLAANRRTCRSQTLVVDTPALWDIDAPHRYLAVTRLHRDDQLIDEAETEFGIRTIDFTPHDGFHLNGRRVPLNGVCQHHDLGALGAAFDKTAAARQLHFLREMGCNAIRTAHNPPAPELLQLCDRLGFLVMDEAFDCWRLGKTDRDYSAFFDDWHERDLRAMLRRDRNHPSVVLWSIGNEILDLLHDPDSWKTARRLAGIVREEDRTRPVTFGCNFEATAEEGTHTAVDVIGFNYKPWAYAAIHKRHPQIPVYGSETSSCISSRDTYFFPVSDDKSMGSADYQVSSYGLTAPPWAWPPDREFAGLDDAPHAAGEFVWTGFDYLGEPTPYNNDLSNLLNFSDPADHARAAQELQELGKHSLPARSSYFGILDLAGFRKDRFYQYQARWCPHLPVAHLLPHWNWPERVGEITPVHLFTNGDEAELFLNGHSLGTRRRGPRDYRLRWNEVVYEPGELRVVVTRRGEPWTDAIRRTTGPAAAIELEIEPTPPGIASPSLSFVRARIKDADGLTVPTSKPILTFSLEGPAQIVALDNGDATELRAFGDSTRPVFQGRALAIIRLPETDLDPGHLTATALGLASHRIHISTTNRPSS